MNSVVLSVLGGGATAAIIKMGETVLMWFLNRKAAREDHEANAKVGTDKEQSVEIEKLRQDVDALKAAQKAILHDRIKYLCRAFIRAGTISFDDRQDLIDMHEVYHSNGGNGNLDKLMADVNNLPLS